MWLYTLAPDTQQAVEGILRKLREKSVAAGERALGHATRPGDALLVGSAQLDDALKSLGLDEFVHAIWACETPQDAASRARTILRDYVKAWNAGHEWQQHRDLDSGSEHVQAAVTAVMTAVDRAESRRGDHEKT